MKKRLRSAAVLLFAVVGLIVAGGAPHVSRR